MTVAEIIERLQELDPELIALRSSSLGFEAVLDIETVGNIVSLDDPDTPRIYAVIF